MPRTFDSESFDIHKFEHGKPDVYPVTKDERIDPGVLKGEVPEAERKTAGKRIFLGIVGNIFLPGLGNVILKKTAVGIALLLINLGLLVATLSPTSMLGFLGNLQYPSYPPAFASGLVIVPSQPGIGIEVNPEIIWVFYLAALLAAASWAHFIYLAAKKGG